ncbi:hypothetical protein HCN44_005918 [Aphidius gifuensis]|uniref:phospholipase A2 n=1 Tax=Aphidius gifuensis TaxID=684658 RepID=A0A835CRB8_APHGI|nr:hypothetical protein HCN44_005918 [Aphidius gifuensis]
MYDTTTTGLSDESNEDYIDNEIDMKKTYVSGIEKLFQSIMQTLMLQQQSSFAAKFISQLPKSVRDFFANQDNDILTSRINGFGDALNAFKEDFHAVFPGTLWCGGGNVAKTNEEVGLFSQVDRCCQHHDQCPYSIQPGETMEQLINNGMFTRQKKT